MSDMTFKKRFVRSLERKEVDKVPVCSVTQTGVVELMDTTGAKWPDAHYDADKMATLALSAHTVAGLEAVRYPFCNTVMAQTLGCTISQGTLDAQPQLLDSPCKKKKDVSNISIPDDLLESERISTMLKVTEIINDRLSGDVPVVAGILGPAAIACYLCGVHNYLNWCITAPEELGDLINIGTAACTEYANALFEHGADAVVVIDSESGPDLFPPPLFESMILPHYRSITSDIKGHSILHICGDATAILDKMAVSGFEGLSIEEKVDLADAKKIVGDRACLIGNVSPAFTLLGRSAEEIKNEAKQCIADGVGILAPGCGLAPHTPINNIKAFVAARDEFYRENRLL